MIDDETRRATYRERRRSEKAAQVRHIVGIIGWSTLAVAVLAFLVIGGFYTVLGMRGE